MPKPVLLVEVAFNAGYSTPAASRTWTDVTSKVRHEDAVRILKWRGEENEVANASRMSLTLENADGRFTPGLTSGAHYPNVKKGRPIRVTVTHNGNTYRRFLGYIEEWLVEWPGVVANSAVCRIAASSRMGRLVSGMELKSIIEEEFLLDSPVAYYTLGEPEGSTNANDTSGNNGPRLEAFDLPGYPAPTFGQATGPATDGLTAVTFATGLRRYLATANFVLDDAPLTIECAFSIASAPTSGGDIMYVFSPTGSVGFGVESDGTAAAGYAGSVFVTGTANLCDGNVHVIAVTASRSGGTGTIELYVDGVMVDSASGAVTSGTPFNTLGVGGAMNSSTDSLAVAHAAVFDAVLSSTRLADHADACLTGFAGETAAARLARYAAYAGIPTAEQSFETGDVPDLAHIDTTGKTALACFREVEATEGGVLFDAGDGTLKFHDRSHRYAAASAFSTSLSPVVVPLTPALDDKQLVNDMTATGSTGIPGRAFDQASLDDYGRYDKSLDVATSDPDEPLMAAAWRVGRYAEPAARIPGVEVHLNKATVALTDSVLAAEVGTKFTLTGLLSNAPASSMVLFVEGEEEYIDATEHRVVLKTSPAAVFDVWILDDSTYSVLGTTTRLAW